MQNLKVEDFKERVRSMSGPIDLGQGAAVDKCFTDLTTKLGTTMIWPRAKFPFN